VTDPNQIKAAIERGISRRRRVPALLEFITAKETRVSKFNLTSGGLCRAACASAAVRDLQVAGARRGWRNMRHYMT
jgi:hypothetical protein